MMSSAVSAVLNSTQDETQVEHQDRRLPIENLICQRVREIRESLPEFDYNPEPIDYDQKQRAFVGEETLDDGVYQGQIDQ